MFNNLTEVEKNRFPHLGRIVPVVLPVVLEHLNRRPLYRTRVLVLGLTQSPSKAPHNIHQAMFLAGQSLTIPVGNVFVFFLFGQPMFTNIYNTRRYLAFNSA